MPGTHLSVLLKSWIFFPIKLFRRWIFTANRSPSISYATWTPCFSNRVNRQQFTNAIPGVLRFVLRTLGLRFLTGVLTFIYLYKSNSMIKIVKITVQAKYIFKNENKSTIEQKISEWLVTKNQVKVSWFRQKNVT